MVFLADVVDVDWPLSGAQNPSIQVAFEVFESPKGSPTRTVVMALPFNAEEFNFLPRQRVLVYAKRWRDEWTTACSRTRVVVPDDQEVASLKRLVTGEPGGVVSGWTEEPAKSSGPFMEPEMVLRLRDEKSIKIRKVTGTTGFDFGWLAPGRYTLEIEKSGIIGRHEILVTTTSRCVFLPDLALNLP